MQNILPHTVSVATVNVTFDPSLVTVTDAGQGAQVGNNSLLWVLNAVAPGQTWQKSFTVRAARTIHSGDSVLTIARMTGGDDTGAKLNPRTASVLTVAIGTLPTTGAAFDILFLFLSGLVALALGVMQKQVQRN